MTPKAETTAEQTDRRDRAAHLMLKDGARVDMIAKILHMKSTDVPRAIERGRALVKGYNPPPAIPSVLPEAE
jgi:DNA-binding transcriptional regulator LsrR (DeoR family)